MKKLLLVAVLLLVMVATATAETCVGVKEGGAGYYSIDDFDAICNLMAHGASVVDVGVAVKGMIRTGRAIDIQGVRISDVEVHGKVAVGTLSNGREIVTFAGFLRCN